MADLRITFGDFPVITLCQYFIHKDQAFALMGNLPSSPLTAVLLEYLLTFNTNFKKLENISIVYFTTINNNYYT